MSKFEILCVTMHQKDFSKLKEMNIHYWITPAKFRSGLFDASFFETPVDIPFEDTVLLGSAKIKDYLTYRYGDYMKLPSEAAQKAAVHAMIFDAETDFQEYIGGINEPQNSCH